MTITLTAGTATGTAVSAETTNTVALPTGYVAGDYTMIVAGSVGSVGGFTTPPAGYSVLLANTDSVNGSTSQHGVIYYKQWVSGDGTVTLTFGSGRVAAVAIKVSGADASSFLDVAAAVTQGAATTTTVDAPSLTTASPNAMLISVFMGRDGSSTGKPTWTPPSGMTELADFGATSTTTNPGIEVAYLAVQTPAATGIKTATASKTVTGSFGISLAIKAAATTFSTSFEVGGAGTAIGTTTGNGGDSFTAGSNGTGTAFVADTNNTLGNIANGTVTGKMTVPATPATVWRGWTISGPQSFRFYMYITAYPTAVWDIVQAVVASGSTNVARLRISTTGQLLHVNNTTAGTATTGVIPLNKLVRIEGTWNTATTATGTFSVEAYLANDTTPIANTSISLTGLTFPAVADQLRFGFPVTGLANATVYLDALAVSNGGRLGPVVNSPMSSLVEDFTTKDQTKWYWDVNAAQTNGTAVLTPSASYNGGIYGNTVYDLTNSALSVQVKQAPNAGNGTTELQVQVFVGADKLFFNLNGGMWAAFRKVGGVQTIIGSTVAYNTATSGCVRIRHSAGLVFWEYSGDGKSWTQFGSWTPTIAITAMKAIFVAGYYGTEPSPGTAIVDNVNVPLDVYGATVAVDTPVAYYRLDGAVDDYMGGAAGTATNGATYGTGLINGYTGQAGSTDGVNDFFSIPDSTALEPTADMTVEAWIKWNAFNGGWMTVATKASGDWSLQAFNGTMQFRANVNNVNTNVSVPTGQDLVTGKIYHIVGVRNGNAVRLYVNGVQVNTNTASTNAIVYGAGPLRIGSWDGVSEFFNGTIDEVAVYNYALSEARIQAHYLAGYVGLAAEFWTGADGSAWPSQWTTGADTANGAAVDIQTNRGRLTSTSVGTNAQGNFALLSGMTASVDFDITVDLTFAATTDAYWVVWARSDTTGWATYGGPNNGYRIAIQPGGTLNLRKTVGGTSTDLALPNVGAWTANVARRVRFKGIGSTIQAKVWDTTASEPTAWNATVTDTSITAAGKIGLKMWNGSANVGALTGYADNLIVTTGAATTVGTWTLWNGTTETTATLDGMWNGASIVPIVSWSVQP